MVYRTRSTPDAGDLDAVFSALAHPVRRALVSRLAAGERASVSELAEPFDMSLMAVSKHLRVMEEAGLLRKERQGRRILCALQRGAMADAAEWIAVHRAFWEDRLDALAGMFDAPEGRSEPG